MFHDFSRKKISMLILVASLLSGSVFVTAIVINYLGRDFLGNSILEARMALDTFQYKVSFAQASNHNLTDTIFSSIENKNLSLQPSQNKAQSIPVLLYHGVINEPDGSNILLENFKDQLFTLKKAGWQTIRIEDFYKFIQGEKELPDKSFLLTFDDSRKDSYYPVDPILKVLDYSAVIYVITNESLNKYLKSPFHLNEGELKKMQKTGRWEIEVHTRDGHDIYKIAEDGTQGHFYSNKLWLEDEGRLEIEDEFKNRIYKDFLGAKNDIEHALGKKVISFAYPFGDFGQDSINFPESRTIISDIINPIYPISFYQVWPRRGFSFNYPNKSQSLLKRILVRPYWSADNLLKVLDIGKEKNLPYVDDFSSYNGWMKTDGKLSIEDNSMTLGSYLSRGSSVFLEGSYLWKDYVFKSSIKLAKGQTFSLLVRYKDDDNYVSCEFAPESIKIQYVAQGEVKLIQKGKGNFTDTQGSHEVGIGIKDNTVDCYMDGQIALKSDNAVIIPSHGGIGFGTWDPQIDNSEIIINEISVEVMQ